MHSTKDESRYLSYSVVLKTRLFSGICVCVCVYVCVYPTFIEILMAVNRDVP